MKLRIERIALKILNDISFELSLGQNVCIIGSNGAGKTTLAKAIAGLIENNSVSIDQIPLAQLKPRVRAGHLNYVPTALHVFDEYISVYEYLELSSLEGADKAKITEVMELLQIRYLQDKSTKVLSSGEANLLQFASSLLHGADFTIFDEPTANLDSDKKILVYNILKNCTKLPSKLVITHDLNLAYRLGYDVLYLQEGKLTFRGSCGDFFSQKNLAAIFGNSIKRVDDYFMVNFQ